MRPPLTLCALGWTLCVSGQTNKGIRIHFDRHLAFSGFPSSEQNLKLERYREACAGMTRMNRESNPFLRSTLCLSALPCRICVIGMRFCFKHLKP